MLTIRQRMESTLRQLKALMQAWFARLGAALQARVLLFTMHIAGTCIQPLAALYPSLLGPAGGLCRHAAGHRRSRPCSLSCRLLPHQRQWWPSIPNIPPPPGRNPTPNLATFYVVLLRRLFAHVDRLRFQSCASLCADALPRSGRSKPRQPSAADGDHGASTSQAHAPPQQLSKAEGSTASASAQQRVRACRCLP